MNNFSLFGNAFSSTPKSRVNPLSNVKPTSKPVVVTLPSEDAKVEDIPVEQSENKVESTIEESIDATTIESDDNTDKVTETNTQTPEEKDQKQKSVLEEQPKKKRHRRTKAEIELAKQQEISEEEIVETEKNTDIQPQKTEKESVEDIAKEPKEETEPEQNEEVNIEQTNVKIPSKEFKFEEVITKFVPAVEDPKWDEQVKYIEDQMNKIHFDSDINAGTIRVMLPLITNLYTYIKRIKPEYETLCEQLISDSIGLIPRQKLANSYGSNSEERKKNGTKACENFKVETMKGTLNLYEFYGIASSRLNYLKAKIECLEFSKSSLIGFLTVITKAEK